MCQKIKVALHDFSTSATKLYSPGLRATTLPLQMVWFSLSFGSYGLATWINTLFVEVHLENVYFNALLFALSNLPGNLISGAWMDSWGRSNMLIGSILAAALSLLAFAWYANQGSSTDSVSQDGEEAQQHSLNTFGIVFSACAFQAFSIVAWNTIDCMSSELFPTTVRSTGMGVCAATGRIGAMLAQLVNGFLVANPVRLLLVASFTLLLGSTTPAWLPAESDLTGQPVHDDVTANDYNALTTHSEASTPERKESSNGRNSNSPTTTYARLSKSSGNNSNNNASYQNIV